MKKIIIQKNNAGVRIDKFLKQELFLNSKITRGEIIRKINLGDVLVNNKKIKPSYELCLGDAIISNFQFPISNKILPNSKIKIKIIFQDNNVIVIDKPAGISVHPSKPGENSTIVNFLIHKFPEIKNIHDGSKDSWMRPGIVHRLDKDTSGVMVVAKNQEAFAELKKLFQEHKVRKKYLALVHGKLEKKKGVIEKPIARAATYKKQVIAGRKTKTKIRPAVTEYKVVKELPGASLVETMPKTGRMHQIRVHLFSIGHPILGDKIYKLKKYKEFGAQRQMLHAKELKFELLGKKYTFASQLSEDFAKILNHLTAQG